MDRDSRQSGEVQGAQESSQTANVFSGTHLSAEFLDRDQLTAQRTSLSAPWMSGQELDGSVASSSSSLEVAFIDSQGPGLAVDLDWEACCDDSEEEDAEQLRADGAFSKWHLQNEDDDIPGCSHWEDCFCSKREILDWQGERDTAEREFDGFGSEGVACKSDEYGERNWPWQTHGVADDNTCHQTRERHHCTGDTIKGGGVTGSLHSAESNGVANEHHSSVSIRDADWWRDIPVDLSEWPDSRRYACHEKYEVLERIGEGTFGAVYKARRKEDGLIVALKKCFKRRLVAGAVENLMREVHALEKVDHPNVVKLMDHYKMGSALILIFEFCPSDLAHLLRSAEEPLGEAAVKGWFLQLLRGIDACHAAGIIHRDLKPANLLIATDGTLKIADFGLARGYFPNDDRLYTHTVATRWYRAPELLYGSCRYGPAVDMWAAGCIFAELQTLKPLFPGDHDIDQLNRVIRTLGTVDEATWPGSSGLPDFGKIIFAPCERKPWDVVLPGASAGAIALLDGLIRYDPESRLTASQAADHSYFRQDPLPLSPADLPVPGPRENPGHDEDWELFSPISPPPLSQPALPIDDAETPTPPGRKDVRK